MAEMRGNYQWRRDRPIRSLHHRGDGENFAPRPRNIAPLSAW